MLMKQFLDVSFSRAPKEIFLGTFDAALKSQIRNRNTTAMSLLSALGLSACGGGSDGSSTAASGQNPSGSQPDTTGGSTPTTDDDNASDTSGGVVLGGGGGGGGGGGATTTSNNLTLTRSGADYVSSSLSGFSLLGTDSHYQVSNSTSDAYNVKLTASGEGMLTFEFIDANDVVTLSSGSSISGFTQLKVIRGTVDITDANTSGLTYVSVASSLKLTTAQILELDAIVINSASGGIKVEVQSQAEIDQITDAMTNGSLNLFSAADNLMTLEAAPGTTVTATDITAGQTSFNTQKRDVSDARESAIIIIKDGNGGLTTSERASETLVNVFPEDGSTFVSARIDGVNVGSIATRSFSFDGSNMDSGLHTLTVTTQNASGVQSVTQEEFFVVGSSNVATDMFEFRSSSSGAVVTVEMYLKNLHQDIISGGGVKSYDFYIDLDQTKFDYVEGSFATASGSINDGDENQANGEIFANGFFTSGPWSSYDDALFTFKASKLSSSQSMEISFVNFNIYTTDFGDFSVSIDV